MVELYYLICRCGIEFSIEGFPETVVCPGCGESYEAVPLPDVGQWLSENWGYVAVGFVGFVALYAFLK